MSQLIAGKLKRKQILKRRWVLCVSLALISPLCFSQEKSVDELLKLPLKEIGEISIATGSSKSLFLAPAVASMITSEDIEAMGATTLDEVLETVPGLHVSVDSYNTFSSNWIIRGVRTNGTPQVLLLINGVHISEAFTGSKPPNLYFPTSMISRVEIIRGPGSAVHGADAFSGTINVVTKAGQEIDGTVGGIRAGSFGRKDAWVQHGVKYKNWDIGLGIDYLSSDGDSNRIIDSDQQTVFDGLFGTSASQAPAPIQSQFNVLNTHINIAKNRWNAQLWYSRARDYGGGPGIADALNNIDDVDSDTFLGSVKYSNKDIVRDWLLDVQVNYKLNKQESLLAIFPPGATLLVGADGNLFTGNSIVTFTDGVIGQPARTQHQFSQEATATYTGLSQHKLRFAIGYEYTDVNFKAHQNFGPSVIDGTISSVDGTLSDVTGTPFIFSPDSDRKLYYLSAQDEWTITRSFELTAGIRYDKYSDFGDTFNPRAALVWQTRYDFVTKLLYGRAFRAPAFAELNAQNNPVGLGNSNLDAEIIDTVELVFDYRPTIGSRLTGNFFYYEIEGLIELADDPGGTRSFQNVRDQEAYGTELEASWKLNQMLSLRGNASWLKATDKNTDKVVPNIPRAQTFGEINYNFLPYWSIDGQWFWVRYRARAATDTRPTIDDYHLVNMILRRKDLFKHIDIALALRNVFDADVREPSSSAILNDYPMESRAVWGEIKVKF